MAETGIDVEPASTLDYVESLLAANDLPVADLRSGAGRFLVARRAGERVGVGGLEVHGTEGLVRSVAVERAARGEGVGTALCDALAAEARTAGVETLYLLTTTAADFFARRGYERCGRDATPPSIRATTEFATLCPEHATVMRRRL